MHVVAQDKSAPCEPLQVTEWYKKKEWLNGLELKPHKSIDQIEFARQFCLNQDWWNKAFTFLRTHDLQQLAPGRYVIDEGNVTAFVSEAPTKAMEEINWETHENFNDLQYVISGKAKMGVASTRSAKYETIMPYDSKKDVANYSVSDGKFYNAEPGTFFIFSPVDIHRPAFKVKGYDSIKKILIKVRVP
tara:strand:+ start:3701 stop:4267 length:567 start_codon:yes stop_codon:yes gene_type:complete